MRKLITLITVVIFTFGFSGIGIAGEVSVVVTGSSWDSDSRGFASIGGLGAII
jgi:hypothetical protein